MRDTLICHSQLYLQNWKKLTNAHYQYIIKGELKKEERIWEYKGISLENKEEYKNRRGWSLNLKLQNEIIKLERHNVFFLKKL